MFAPITPTRIGCAICQRMCAARRNGSVYVMDWILDWIGSDRIGDRYHKTLTSKEGDKIFQPIIATNDMTKLARNPPPEMVKLAVAVVHTKDPSTKHAMRHQLAYFCLGERQSNWLIVKQVRETGTGKLTWLLCGKKTKQTPREAPTRTPIIVSRKPEGT